VASGSSPARQAHGEVAEGDTHHAVVVNGVSSDEEPSVEWGWHGHYPKVARLAGFIVAAVLLIMLYSNYYNGEDQVWLIALAAGFFFLSLGSVIRARTSWRR
jgi:hypothetical protein